MVSKLSMISATLAVLLSTAGGAEAGDHVVYQLGWLPSGSNAAIYVGLREGLFTKAGLDVEVKTGRGSTDALTKVMSGLADFGEVSLSSLLVAKSEGAVKAVAVMPLFTRPPDALLTVKGGGIKKFSDVAGKTIATSPFSSSNIMWPLVLKANGIQPDRVTLKQVDASTFNGLMANGQVDGLITWTSNTGTIALALEAQGKTLQTFEWADAGYKGYSQVLVATPETLVSKRDVAARFLKAYRQAEISMKTNPSDAAKDLLAAVPQADLKSVEWDVRATIPLIFNDTTDRDGLGKFNPDLVKTTWEWVARSQSIPVEKIDPQSVIDGSIAP